MGAPHTQNRIEESAEPVDEILRALAHRLGVAVDDLEMVGRYVKKPVFAASLKEAVKEGVAEALSPWADPAAAAARSRSSEAMVALMAKLGVINQYGSDHKPIYATAEIDAAIRERRWTSVKPKKKSG